jgi:hypothetical protein
MVSFLGGHGSESTCMGYAEGLEGAAHREH